MFLYRKICKSSLQYALPPFSFFLKRNTSRQTKPLKVQVMHSSIVAHQSFGLKLLTWLGSVIGYSGGQT